MDVGAGVGVFVAGRLVGRAVGGGVVGVGDALAAVGVRVAGRARATPFGGAPALELLAPPGGTLPPALPDPRPSLG